MKQFIYLIVFLLIIFIINSISNNVKETFESKEQKDKEETVIDEDNDSENSNLTEEEKNKRGELNKKSTDQNNKDLRKFKEPKWEDKYECAKNKECSVQQASKMSKDEGDKICRGYVNPGCNYKNVVNAITSPPPKKRRFGYTIFHAFKDYGFMGAIWWMMGMKPPYQDGKVLPAWEASKPAEEVCISNEKHVPKGTIDVICGPCPKDAQCASKLGEYCNIHEDCMNYGPGGVSCCQGICKKEQPCKAGKLGDMCKVATDCAGWGPNSVVEEDGPNKNRKVHKVVCCSDAGGQPKPGTFKGNQCMVPGINAATGWCPNDNTPSLEKSLNESCGNHMDCLGWGLGTNQLTGETNQRTLCCNYNGDGNKCSANPEKNLVCKWPDGQWLASFDCANYKNICKSAKRHFKGSDCFCGETKLAPIGGKCNRHEDCAGFGRRVGDAACCGGICKKKVNRLTKAEKVLVDMFSFGMGSTLINPGWCPQKLGEKCSAHDECDGKGLGPYDTACCKGKCTYKRKDWIGAGWCPHKCKAKADGKPGSCAKNNPRENNRKSAQCVPSKMGRWYEIFERKDEDGNPIKGEKYLNLNELCSNNKFANGPYNCSKAGNVIPMCKGDHTNKEYCMTKENFIKNLKKLRDEIHQLQKKIKENLVKKVKEKSVIPTEKPKPVTTKSPEEMDKFVKESGLEVVKNKENFEDYNKEIIDPSILKEMDNIKKEYKIQNSTSTTKNIKLIIPETTIPPKPKPKNEKQIMVYKDENNNFGFTVKNNLEISGVKSSDNSYLQGLRNGMILTHINNEKINNINEFKKIWTYNVFDEKKPELLLTLKCKKGEDCFNQSNESQTGNSKDEDIFLNKDLKFEQKIDYYTGKLRPLTDDEKKYQKIYKQFTRLRLIYNMFIRNVPERDIGLCKWSAPPPSKCVPSVRALEINDVEKDYGVGKTDFYNLCQFQQQGTNCKSKSKYGVSKVCKIADENKITERKNNVYKCKPVYDKGGAYPIKYKEGTQLKKDSYTDVAKFCNTSKNKFNCDNLLFKDGISKMCKWSEDYYVDDTNKYDKSKDKYANEYGLCKGNSLVDFTCPKNHNSKELCDGHNNIANVKSCHWDNSITGFLQGRYNVSVVPEKAYNESPYGYCRGKLTGLDNTDCKEFHNHIYECQERRNLNKAGVKRCKFVRDNGAKNVFKPPFKMPGRCKGSLAIDNATCSRIKLPHDCKAKKNLVDVKECLWIPNAPSFMRKPGVCKGRTWVDNDSCRPLSNSIECTKNLNVFKMRNCKFHAFNLTKDEIESRKRQKEEYLRKNPEKKPIIDALDVELNQSISKQCNPRTAFDTDVCVRHTNSSSCANEKTGWPAYTSRCFWD